jgi:hypothetical protein
MVSTCRPDLRLTFSSHAGCLLLLQGHQLLMLTRSDQKSVVATKGDSFPEDFGLARIRKRILPWPTRSKTNGRFASRSSLGGLPATARSKLLRLLPTRNPIRNLSPTTRRRRELHRPSSPFLSYSARQTFCHPAPANCPRLLFCPISP